MAAVEMNSVVVITLLGLTQGMSTDLTETTEQYPKYTGDDLYIIQSTHNLVTTFDLSDLHTSVEVRQVLEEIHEKFFPRMNVLILSNYTRAMELLKIADHFDQASNRITDFRHYSYWMVACYSPCEPSPSSHIYHLENVVLISSQLVVEQLVMTQEGGYFSAGKGLEEIRYKQDVFPNTGYGLNQRTLIVSTIPYGSFVMKTEKGFEGYLIDVLTCLAFALNFSYEIVNPDGMRWGELVEGRWDGIVGQLERREVDLAVAALTIHEDREKVMDFLYPPVYAVKDDIMYKLQTEHTKRWKIYLNPFSSLVLFLLTIILMACTLLGYILYWWDDTNTGQERTNTWKSRMRLISDTLFYLFGILISRGMEFKPMNQSTRLLLFTWGVFSLITVTCYSAKLVSMFTVQKPTLPFTNLAELVKQEEYKWGMVSGAFMEHIFRQSKSEDMKLAWLGVQEFNKTDPDVLSEDESVHISKVRTEKYAFFTNREIIERAMHQDCDIRYIGEAISWEQYGIGVPTDYPLSGEIERVLSTIIDSGLPDFWWRQWNRNNSEHCKRDIKVNTLTLQDIISLFFLLCVGLGASLVVLAVEHIKHKLANS